MRFRLTQGEWNPADVLSKHWGHAQVWTLLQPILFWKGDTADLLEKDNILDKGKGSNKCSLSPGIEPQP